MPITNPEWIPPIEMTFDVGKPIRSEQGSQLAFNPIAIAQGAPGAPRVVGRALDKVFLGNLISSNLNTNPVGILDLDGLSGILFVGLLTGGPTSSNRQLSIEYSTDNGATFGAAQTLYSSATAGIVGSGHLDFLTGDFVFCGQQVGSFGGSPDEVSRSTTVPVGMNAFRFSANSGESARVSLSCSLVGGVV